MRRGACVTVPLLMNKDQLRFLLSGILFGFLVGYVIAYAVHEPKVVQQAAPVPAAGNMGMGQGAVAAGGAPGGDAPAGAPPGGPAGGGRRRGQGFQGISALKGAREKNPKEGQGLPRLAKIDLTGPQHK